MERLLVVSEAEADLKCDQILHLKKTDPALLLARLQTSFLNTSQVNMMAFQPASLPMIWAALSFFVLYRVGIIFYRLFFHPLAKFPGPKYLAASGLPHIYYNNVKGEWYRQVKDLHDKYGDMVRIAPNTLAVDGSVGWEDVFGHKIGDREEFGKDPAFYRPVDDSNGATDMLDANRTDHRRQRRLVSHAFSDSALLEQESLIKSYIDLLMLRLKALSTEGEFLDIVKWYNFTTFDIIADLTFGDPFHCLENSKMHPWIAMIFNSIKFASMMRIFNFYPILKPLLPLLITEDARQNRAEHVELVSSKTHARIALGNDTPKKDFMSFILRHNDSEKGMSHAELLGTADLLIIAGSETTATLLSGLTYHLARNPESWDRLKTEVRGTFSSEDEITMRSTNTLPYLHACLEEGLRIHPPAVETPPRFSPGGTIDGKYVAKGTRIIIHQWATHHQARNFAKPDEFIPERWLAKSHPLFSEEFVNDNRASMQPFSHGPRNCLGKNLAYAEMRMIMARLAWNFELEVAPQSIAWVQGQKVYLTFEKPSLLMKLHLKDEKNIVEDCENEAAI
ncbi:hypothetical protein BP5796_09903 [Coleophoma crateriformis]|uniref:Uncharacterized protein n=1 Tax=Coleophoma crateriformis TaxID=565419 RepID=A0A3D8QU53_9HELO|nr:hypothetical protein BP5796_09903 [Coleophoma crateriformis]